MEIMTVYSDGIDHYSLKPTPGDELPGKPYIVPNGLKLGKDDEGELAFFNEDGSLYGYLDTSERKPYIYKFLYGGIYPQEWR